MVRYGAEMILDTARSGVVALSGTPRRSTTH